MFRVASRIPIIGRLLKKTAPRYRTYQGIESVRTKANVFYYPIRALFRTVARTQHAEIRAIGLENIPGDGSVLLVGNHPNSLLDFFNLLVVVRHPVGTLIKDTLTRIPIVGPIVRNFALMVPISRRMDSEETGLEEDDRRSQNEESLKEAVELLVKGRILNVYAEGRSTDSRKLGKIKLGFMHLALSAEREFDFRLNLRIVPYGYYYDRINKFQSSVCVVFGRPFKLKSLMDIPKDFANLREGERKALEKRLMLEGKNRLKSAVEDLIISIPEQSLVDLIDELTHIYVSTPAKYMGRYSNVAEKYRMSKLIAESVQRAHNDTDGRNRLRALRTLVSDYRTALAKGSMSDRLIRREQSVASVGYHLKAVVLAVLSTPLTLYGYAANLIPKQLGRFRRYWVIDVQKRQRVDGDEQAIVWAFAGVLFTYPVYWALIYYWMKVSGLVLLSRSLASFDQETLAAQVAMHPILSPLLVATAAVYLMGRLWRFSLFHGRRMRQAFSWLYDTARELLFGGRIRDLRKLRYEITDCVDFLVGDFHDS
ncbi:MAG: 1-acyl-sn-glycerol-3-phosphate acyltransferase [Spirochaetia bacterium]|nr:1-acyl-sn-glycerol-3-phosphate acyltransferase [Spirochaetia bacterium]